MDYLSTLQQATNKTTTENGGITNLSSLDPCLDFFALGAAKRNNPPEAVKLFRKAYSSDKTTALRTLFYIRDVRGGQGEREIFRACLKDLSKNDPEIAKKVLRFVPEYGRFDDLFVCKDTPVEQDMANLMKEQVRQDLKVIVEEGEEAMLAYAEV